MKEKKLMNDSFINALNTQKTTLDWMDSIIMNMVVIFILQAIEIKK